MSGHNVVLSNSLVCPRCKRITNPEVHCEFGDSMAAVTLRVGDPYPWYEPPDALEQAEMIQNAARIVGSEPSRIERTLKSYVKRAGRPPNGDLEGVGWCRCPVCDADFFTVVSIRSDIVKEVVPDLFRFPLGPDTWFDAKGIVHAAGATAT
jgi:hypothetical protein